MIERRYVLAFALAMTPVACGGTKTAAPPTVPLDVPLPQSPALRYLPLVDGNMWSYDARDDDNGEQGMFVTRIRRLSQNRFSLMSTQGAHQLEVRGDGIARVDSDTYVLKAPFTVGSEWPGEAGSTVRLTALDRAVDCPAGQFVGCIETVEEVRGGAGPNPLRRVTTTYCPDVGVALLHAEAWRGKEHVGEKATLRSFGKPVEVPTQRGR